MKATPVTGSLHTGATEAVAVLLEAVIVAVVVGAWVVVEGPVYGAKVEGPEYGGLTVLMSGFLHEAQQALVNNLFPTVQSVRQ